MATFFKVLRFIGKYRFLLVLSVILAAVTVILQLYVPVLFGYAIDEVVAAHEVDFGRMGFYLSRILVMIVLSGIATWVMSIINNRMTYRTVQDIRAKSIRHIQKLPLSYLDGHSTGDIISRVIADTDILSDGMLLGFTQLFSGIITIIGTLNALVSAHTHLSTSFTCRRSFGIKGAKIIGIILCISNFGWYAFQADLFGTTIASVIKHINGSSVNSVIFTIIGGITMSLTAIFGFKAIKLLSEVGLPLLAVLCVIAVWKTSSMISFGDIWNAGPVSTPITIPMGIAAVVGSFAVGVTMVGDFSRFSKSKRDCMIGVSIGHCWGYIPILMCGAFFNYAFHNWNIVEIMILSLGLGLFGALVLIIGQWTTNDNNLYTSVLGLMNTLDGISKVPRMRLTLIVGLISTAIAAVGLYKYFVTFLSLLGVFITPIGGILIADFYICNRKNYDGGDVPQGIKWDAIVSWAVASFVGVTMTARPVGLGWFVAVGDVIPVPLICIAVAMVLYVVSQKLQNRKLQNKAGAV